MQAPGRRLGRILRHLTSATANPAELPEPASFEVSDHSAAATVPMTDEQRFFFDLKGWILLPAVLSPTEIVDLKAEVIDRGKRNCYDGKLQCERQRSLRSAPTPARVMLCSLRRPDITAAAKQHLRTAKISTAAFVRLPLLA